MEARKSNEMDTYERKMAIWNMLRQHKQDAVGRLAAEFHVFLYTIYYALETLSRIYSLEVIHGRYHGGIKIADYFTPDKTKLPPVQRGLLLCLCVNLYRNDKLIMLNILKMNRRILKMLCHKGGATFTVYS